MIISLLLAVACPIITLYGVCATNGQIVLLGVTLGILSAALRPRD